jgi:hypothetical protein
LKSTGATAVLVNATHRDYVYVPTPHLAKALDGRAGTEVFRLERLAHFDLAFPAMGGGIRRALGPFERFVPGFHLYERVAPPRS